MFYNDRLIYEFPNDIRKTVEVKNMLIVLLRDEYKKVSKNNVFCLSKEGELLWQLKEPKGVEDYDYFFRH